MKTLILTLILLSSNLYSQSNSKVDKRVELLTIIARLAEFDEYCSTPLIKYGRDIDDFFKGHKNHKVVSIFKQLREEQGLGYDAVMSMAVHLNPPPTLTPKVEITIDVLDNRWGNNEIIQEFSSNSLNYILPQNKDFRRY